MFLEAVGHIGWWSAFLFGSAERPPIQTGFKFKKQSALSQYAISGPNKLILLSVPTVKESRKELIGEVQISYAELWQHQHWNSLVAAYRSAPFFPYYAPLLEELYREPIPQLFHFQLRMFKQLCRALRVSDQIEMDNSPVWYAEPSWREADPYPQVFDEQIGFNGNVCVLDMLFNLGPETLDRLKDHSSMIS